ncbi:hypothetical protein DLREEDagrD3_22400 [Denitratisoma sp. agr-D3]
MVTISAITSAAVDAYCAERSVTQVTSGRGLNVNVQRGKDGALVESPSELIHGLNQAEAEKAPFAHADHYFNLCVSLLGGILASGSAVGVMTTIGVAGEM